MARNIYGLDLGTDEIKVYDKRENKVFKYKNTIAIRDKKEYIAYADSAFEMYEKAPSNIEVVFPMKEGVISRYKDLQHLLNYILKQSGFFSRASEYVIAVPTDVTEVEKKAFFDLGVYSAAKAKNVSIVERGLADALGFQLDIKNEKAAFIVNLGGETTEISIVSYGGIVLNKLVKRGGNHMDQSIQNLVRYHHNFLIGANTAQFLRRELNVFSNEGEESLLVPGRDLASGVPQRQEIKRQLIRTAMKDILDECIKAMKQMFERTPPDIMNIIKENGVYLSGGMVNMYGLDTYIAESLNLPVKISEHPEFNAINGIAKIIESKELSNLKTSMLEGSYRWMR